MAEIAIIIFWLAVIVMAWWLLLKHNLEHWHQCPWCATTLKGRDGLNRCARCKRAYILEGERVDRCRSV